MDMVRIFTNADLFYTNVSESRTLDDFEAQNFSAPKEIPKYSSILSKILFLTYFYFPIEGESVLLIVSDVFPRELVVLKQFFPEIKIVVYSDRTFKKIPHNVEYRNTPLDADLHKWANHPSVYLYSSNEDLEVQKRWLLSLKPVNACLRVCPDGEYFDGYLLKQPWENAFVSSAWLVPTKKEDGSYNFRNYDQQDFLEKLFFFSTKARVNYIYRNPFEEGSQPVGPNLTNKYDDTATVIILKMYYEKIKYLSPSATEVLKLLELLDRTVLKSSSKNGDN